MRDSADIRVDRDRHHARALRSLGVKRLELIPGSAEELLRLVVLKNHHRDIVQLHSIGERGQGTVCGFDLVGLINVNPVGDVLKASLSQEIQGLGGLGESWAEPP